VEAETEAEAELALTEAGVLVLLLVLDAELLFPHPATASVITALKATASNFLPNVFFIRNPPFLHNAVDKNVINKAFGTLR